jgi:hypothetical protein
MHDYVRHSNADSCQLLRGLTIGAGGVEAASLSVGLLAGRCTISTVHHTAGAVPLATRRQPGAGRGGSARHSDYPAVNSSTACYRQVVQEG